MKLKWIRAGLSLMVALVCLVGVLGCAPSKGVCSACASHGIKSCSH